MHIIYSQYWNLGVVGGGLVYLAKHWRGVEGALPWFGQKSDTCIGRCPDLVKSQIYHKSPLYSSQAIQMETFQTWTMKIGRNKNLNVSDDGAWYIVWRPWRGYLQLQNKHKIQSFNIDALQLLSLILFILSIANNTLVG